MGVDGVLLPARALGSLRSGLGTTDCMVILGLSRLLGMVVDTEAVLLPSYLLPVARASSFREWSSRA